MDKAPAGFGPESRSCKQTPMCGHCSAGASQPRLPSNGAGLIPPPLPSHLTFNFIFLVKNLPEAAASKTNPHQGSHASKRLRTESLTFLVGRCKPEPWHGQGVTGINKRMLLRGQTRCCWGNCSTLNCKEHLKLSSGLLPRNCFRLSFNQKEACALHVGGRGSQKDISPLIF